MDLAKHLRAAILASGQSQRQLSILTGVPQQRISAFLAGGDMKLKHAGALLDVPAIRKAVLKSLRP